MTAEDELGAYLLARWIQLERSVDTVLAQLTGKERRLVHDLVVVANVRGIECGRFGEYAPGPDSLVIRDVISRCLQMPDVYPFIDALRQDGEEKDHGNILEDHS